MLLSYVYNIDIVHIGVTLAVRPIDLILTS